MGDVAPTLILQLELGLTTLHNVTGSAKWTPAGLPLAAACTWGVSYLCPTSTVTFNPHYVRKALFYRVRER